MIYSRFNRPAVERSFIGDALDPVFEERVVDGVQQLVEVKKEPINPFVQSSLAGTLVYNILAKYERGDIDALQRVAGQYIDVTGMPKNLAEAQQQIINISRQFDALPLDVRNKFGNNVDMFIKTVAEGNLNDFVKEFFPDHIKPGAKVSEDVVKKGGE